MRLPFLPLVTDAVTVVFGLWTVVSTATVIAGGTTRNGLNTGALLLLALLCTVGLSYRRRSRWIESYLADAASSEALAAAELGRPARAALIAAIPLTVALWLSTRSGFVAWGAAVLVFAACCYAALGQRVQQAQPAAEPTTPPWQRYALHALALGCACFTLLSFRPRTDDAFYVNMAVAVADHPDAPLFAHDLIHGPPDQHLPVQPMFAPYRLHSFESLAGYISYLTGIEAIAVIHFGLATFFAWLAPLAIARLLRLLAPRAWLFALIVTLSYYVIEGSAARGFSNQALVRLFNGKSVLLTIAVPLLILYGLRFGLRPTPVRFVLLSLAQIAAVGLSSTGLWLAPTLAMCSIAAATGERRAARVTLPLGILSSAYLVVLGLWTLSQLRITVSPPIKVVEAGATGTDAGFSMLAWVVPEVLGNERCAIALLCMFALACILAERAVVLRLFALSGLLVSAILANPWLIILIASTLTGKLTYERIFWLLPVPIALGLLVTSVRARLCGRMPVIAATLVATALLAAFYLVATERLVISEKNHAQLKYPPVLKQWPAALETARTACALAPPGSRVLAPKEISRSLGMLHHCAHPLIAEMRWMKASVEEERRRNLLVRYVSSSEVPSDERTAELAALLDRYDLPVVVTSKEGTSSRRVRSLLRRAGYERAPKVADNQIWIHAGKESLDASARVARSVCRLVTRDDVVLAPFSISQAIAAQGCARAPLGGRDPLGADPESMRLLELEDRLFAARDLTGAPAAELAHLLDQIAARAVVVTRHALRRALHQLLRDARYAKLESPDGFHVFVRDEQPAP